MHVLLSLQLLLWSRNLSQVTRFSAFLIVSE